MFIGDGKMHARKRTRKKFVQRRRQRKSNHAPAKKSCTYILEHTWALKKSCKLKIPPPTPHITFLMAYLSLTDRYIFVRVIRFKEFSNRLSEVEKQIGSIGAVFIPCAS